jgi:serine/threonine protein kinase
MVLQDGYFDKHCEKCDEWYANVKVKWCRLCQSSGNEQIDDFIYEKQLTTNQHDIVKWIPYNQFTDIKEIGKGGFATIYSAIWKNNKKIALKHLHNSQNIVNEFLNEVWEISVIIV